MISDYQSIAPHLDIGILRIADSIKILQSSAYLGTVNSVWRIRGGS